MVGASALRLPATEASSVGPPSRLPTLTSIRFVAALWVVLYHYDTELLAAFPWLSTLLHSGATGVSLFYVLSGFILAHTYWNRDVTSWGGAVDFYVHRLARIYPMYLVSLAVMLPKLLIFRDDWMVRYAFAHPWFVTLSHLTLTHNWLYYPIGVLNGPTWSVSCEAGFYLLFPSLLPLVRRMSARGALIALVLVFALSAILPSLYAVSAFPHGAGALGLEYTKEIDERINQSIRMWPILRLGEFAIGLLIAVLLHRHPKWSLQQRSALLLFVAVAAVAYAASLRTQTLANVLLLQQVTPVPFFAAGILALAVFGGERPRWLTTPWSILLGEASYSLYLLHVPVKQALRFAGERAGIAMIAPGPAVASILITIPLAILAFRYIETPARKWIVARYAPRRPTVSAMA